MTANAFIPWSDEEREQLRRLHENGLSFAQIAAHLGRSKNSVSRQVARLGLLTNEPGAVKAADQHDWLLITAPNGDQGYQCQRCRATAIHIPVRQSLRQCPMPHVPPLARPVGHPRAPRTTLPPLPSLRVDD